MKKYLVLIFFSINFLTLFGQYEYSFKRWKLKQDFSAIEKVILIIDSTSNSESIKFIKKLGDHISIDLKERGINCESTFNQKEKFENNVLAIKFEMGYPVYVQFSMLGNKFSLCNTIKIYQINNLPKKQKWNISTTLAISVEKEELVFSNAVNALSNCIERTLTFTK